MAEAGVGMISDFFTESFTVQQQTTATTVSTIGSWKPTWGTLGTFKGFMDYAVVTSGREMRVGAQYIDKATHIIGAPSTCTWIKNSHRILDSDSLIYRVLHVDNPIRRDHHIEILLEYNESDNLST
jgi:hypothetical protein